MGSNTGLILSVLAHLTWGFFPIYLSAIGGVSDLEVLAHRSLWSFGVLAGWVLLTRSKTAGQAFRWQNLRVLILTATLVCANWLIFIYAVSTGQTLESSFGYFICPVLMILAGVVFLKERLSRPEIISLTLIALAVAYQIFTIGHVPWVALGLAVTFALYSLLRKTISVSAVDGMLVETSLIAPFALALMGYLWSAEQLAFLNTATLQTNWLLAGLGIVSAVPVVLFVWGSKLMKLASVGFLGYLTPSLHFLVAVFVFGEPLNQNKLISFAIVWLGLAVLVVSPRLKMRKPLVLNDIKP